MAEKGDDSDKPDDASKTEEPSQKKLEEARNRGQVAQSKELNTWVMLLATTLIVGMTAGPIFTNVGEVLKSFLERSGTTPVVSTGLGHMMSDTFWTTTGLLIIPFALLIVAALIGSFAQVGFLIAPEVIKPDLSKISILKGFERLFSMRSIVEFLKGIIKLVAVGVVAYVLMAPYFDNIEQSIGKPLPILLDELQGMTIKMLIGILVILLIMSLLDVLYQRFEFFKQMRMTKQELKDEFKQTEGDPYIKGKLKQLRMEKARQRMMAAVPRADVVITNPTHYSIALEYKPEKMDAPVLIAKGVDELALRIREIAKENKIEIVENKPLARALYDEVELDETIPPEFFKAVAEVISYVLQKQGKIKPKKPLN